jgi:predicted MFS family arabinose efflux permease
LNGVDPVLVETPAERGVFREIILLTLVRLGMNSANRMIYPFMPAFSRGLGISTSSGRLLISARSIAGGVSFLFGPTSDRYGRRNVMLAALSLFTVALIMVPVLPYFPVVVGVFVVFGLSKAIFDPSVLAFVGDAVPYSKRGLAIGIIEMAWSTSLLISVPLIGILIEKYGWKSPFYALIGYSILGMALITRRLPGHKRKIDNVEAIKLSQAWKLLKSYPIAMQAIGFSFVVHVANESIFVVYGEWMEGSFGLKVGILGIVTTIVGLAELLGEMVVIFYADRIGKKRVTVWGILTASLFYIIFPLISNSLWLCLMVLFLMFSSWEAGIVSSISLFSEQMPEGRGTMMASNVTAISLGRVVGALVGGWLWDWTGFVSNGVFAGILSVIAVVILLKHIKEKQ